MIIYGKSLDLEIQLLLMLCSDSGFNVSNTHTHIPAEYALVIPFLMSNWQMFVNLNIFVSLSQVIVLL